MSAINQALADLEELEPTARNYIIENLDSLVHEFLIPEIVAMAHAQNLPLEFIAGIGWVRSGELSGRIVNTWGSDEKPLALWFNDGTVDHWIGGNPVLAWEATFGRNPTAIFFGSGVEEGTTLFSRGHFVKGIPKTEVMQRGIQAGMKRLQSAILKNSKQQVSKELETIV